MAQSESPAPGRSTAVSQEWAVRYADVAAPPTMASPAGLRAALRHAGLMLAGSLAQASEHAFLRCLYLHHVYDDQVEGFRDLLEELMRIGEFVDTHEAVRMALGERPVERRYFHLSFDDGFDNNYRNAFPLLDELGIRAAFFVPSALIDASDRDALERWWTKGEVRLPTRPLRWDWLREMSRHGHEIGSHTRTHARLAEISKDSRRLADEVRGSKREIEDALGRPCRYISWPFGTGQDIDVAATQAIESAGYEACFSAIRGKIAPGATPLLRLPRHHFEAHWPWLHVRFFALGGRERAK